MTLPTWNPKTKAECLPGYAILSDHADRDVDAFGHLFGALGGNTYTLAEDHDHDGANSAQIAASDLSGSIVEGQIGTSAVSRTKLKTSSESQSYTVTGGAGHNLSFVSISEWGFVPYTSVGSSGSSNASFYWGGYSLPNGTGNGFYHGVYMGGATNAAYSTIRYVTASPPHRLFEAPGEDHGLWLFRILDKKGEPVGSWLGREPPWARSAEKALGPEAKVAPGRALLLPHPWARTPGLDTANPSPVPGELPPGWRIELIDLRALNTRERYRPKARALAKAQASAGELAGKGIGLATLRALERRLEVAAEAELADQARAEAELDREGEALAEAEYRIARDWTKTEDQKERLRQRLAARLADRRERLLEARGDLRRFEILERESPPGIDLGTFDRTVLDGELPEIDQATRSLSDDTRHPDHKHLPQIPGIFVPGQDGSRPLIEVRTQP